MEYQVTSKEAKLCGRCSKPKGGVKGEDDGFCNCGRPTKYTTDEDMVAKVEEYLEGCVDVERELDKGYAIKVNLPKRVGLANFLNVQEETLVNWGEEHPQFLSALKKLDHLQQERLIDSGLSGDYNPTIAKLILSANHGMAEKTQQDITSGGEKLDSVDKETKHKIDTILNDYIAGHHNKRDEEGA